MAAAHDCIFCKIVRDEAQSWKVWESDKHLAFLSIYPNMKGVTIVIPKEHRPSYAFALEDKELADLIIASKKVAQVLDAKLKGVGRTALVFEGFGVDHVHAKLYPLPNTAHLVKKWEPVKSDHKIYFDKYKGYVCSNDYLRTSDADLDELIRIIKS
jgi:diadenosine tetraphosphate (Ap4A) HIT family hydrolase